MILAALQELYFDIYELWIWQACLYEPLFLYERKSFLVILGWMYKTNLRVK